MKKKKRSVFLLALSLVLVIAVFLYMRGGDSLTQQSPDISPPVGETIQFGNLNWLVLEIDGDRALILSEKILENKAYHSPGGSITWQNCTLREYLNGSFYNNTFNDEEKERLIETEVANKANG